MSVFVTVSGVSLGLSVGVQGWISPVCGSACIHLPLPVYACVALPASPVACLTRLVLACLPLFASAVCVCFYRGHQAMASELRTV